MLTAATTKNVDMSQKQLERLNIAAAMICFCCIGLSVGFMMGALIYRSWSVLAVGLGFTLIGYLLTYMGDYCEDNLHE